MNTDEMQKQLFSHHLEGLALKYPSLYFEDRQNEKYLARYNEEDRPAKKCKLEFARFQAWRPVVQTVNLPPLPRVRAAVYETVTFRRLVAWASSPTRLAEILIEKGVRG
jgi:hypothetical protein